jgi:hypothetical protein
MPKALVLLLMLSAALFAADMTGKWVFDVETDAGSGSPVFVLKQEGEKLSGTYSGALGEAKVAGSVRGTDVTIEFEASGYKVVYKGTLEGETKVKGTVDIGGQAKGTFNGSKR